VPDAAPAEELLAEFDGLAEAVCDRLDQVELTGALDEIWQRIKRLNRYVQDEQPWQLAKDPAQAERLDQVLFTLAEGLRVVSVLLHPFMPGSAERLLAALRQEDRSLEQARLGAWGGGAEIGELGQLFPRVETPEPSAA
jgi:methionyl-tRNA synthetase